MAKTWKHPDYSTPIGTTEASQRLDGKFNIWRYAFAFDDDLVPSWILIAVVRKPKEN